MTRVILSILGNWPGPSAWRRLHRATRQQVLDLAEEVTNDGSLWGWVHVVGAVVVTIWRLVMIPSSAAHEILRMDDLVAEQHAARDADRPIADLARRCCGGSHLGDRHQHLNLEMFR